MYVFSIKMPKNFRTGARQFTIYAGLICAGWLVFGYAIEYILPLHTFEKHSGVVEYIDRSLYECKGYGRYGATSCERTIIRLTHNDNTFRVADYAYRGASIEGVEIGDSIDIYKRRGYQYLLTFGDSREIYHLEKQGAVLYSLEMAKHSGKANFYSGIAFFLLFGLLQWIEVQAAKMARKAQKQHPKGVI